MAGACTSVAVLFTMRKGSSRKPGKPWLVAALYFTQPRRHVSQGHNMDSQQAKAWFEIAQKVDALLAAPGARERFRERVEEAAAEWLRRFNEKGQREDDRTKALRRLGVPVGAGRLSPDPGDGAFHWVEAIAGSGASGGRSPLEAWLPAGLSPNLDPDDSLPLRVPAKRDVSLAERYAVLGAVWDAHWRGDDKIDPWAGEYSREAVWYLRLVHADDPAFSTEGPSNQDAAIVRTWIDDVQADLAGAKSAASTALPPVNKKPKRSTERGDAEVKIIAALTQHHRYQVFNLPGERSSSLLHQEPTGCNALARKARVSKSSVSRFFKKWFKGHRKYRRVCKDFNSLISSLKMLNRDWCPWNLYDKEPPADHARRAADAVRNARAGG